MVTTGAPQELTISLKWAIPRGSDAPITPWREALNQPVLQMWGLRLLQTWFSPGSGLHQLWSHKLVMNGRESHARVSQEPHLHTAKVVR